VSTGHATIDVQLALEMAQAMSSWHWTCDKDVQSSLDAVAGRWACNWACS
jgi:hypothetical protein